MCQTVMGTLWDKHRVCTINTNSINNSLFLDLKEEVLHNANNLYRCLSVGETVTLALFVVEARSLCNEKSNHNKNPLTSP